MKIHKIIKEKTEVANLWAPHIHRYINYYTKCGRIIKEDLTVFKEYDKCKKCFKVNNV